MKLRKFVVLHCTATPEGRDVKPEEVRAWHKKRWPTKVHGRDQIGYSELILLNGDIHFLCDYNYDKYVDLWEITNGVGAINNESLHICYVGGCDKDMKPKNTLSARQEESFQILIKTYMSLWPDIKFAGHNQFTNKGCPSFDVPKMLRKWGVPERNIYVK
jgi:hypothetical protein